MIKTCITCDTDKEENVFNFRFIKRTQKYDNSCRECNAIYQKNYHQNNKDRLNAYHRNYYKENKEEVRVQQKEYLVSHKEQTKSTNKQYQKMRRANDPSFKLRGNVSNMVGKALRAMGKSKNGQSIFGYLPYSIQELKEHLEKQFEPWMTWSNYGSYGKDYNEDDISTWKWNIDHIIPQSSFPYTSMTDNNFVNCWALSNLRPLFSKKNIEKGNR